MRSPSRAVARPEGGDDSSDGELRKGGVGVVMDDANLWGKIVRGIRWVPLGKAIFCEE